MCYHKIARRWEEEHGNSRNVCDAITSGKLKFGYNVSFDGILVEYTQVCIERRNALLAVDLDEE